MRKKIRIWSVVLTTMLTFTVMTASAADRLVVKIPFDFRVGDTQLNAGTYIVKLLFGGTTLQIESNDKGKSLYGMTIAEKSGIDTQNVLTFNRYGSTYYLSEVSWESIQSTRKLLPAKSETELARNTAPLRIVRVVAR